MARDVNRQQGMSLIETLLSLLLLSFIVLGSISLLTISSRQNKMAQRRSIATSLAAERLDRLTAAPFRNSADVLALALTEESTASGPPAVFTADYNEIPGFPQFRRVVTLEYDVPEAGLLKAKVEVYWQDQKQGEKEHALLTFLHPELDWGDPEGREAW